MSEMAPRSREDQDPVQYDVTDGVATITLNRPEGMNGLTVRTKEDLLQAVYDASEDEEVRCVVLTGTGRAFCAGQDLKEHAQILQGSGSRELFETVERHYNPTVAALLDMPKPVIAAVNGVAAGAGASLAMACDLRIVAESAGFNMAFAGIGLSCDTGSSWTLPRLVGYGKAIELLYFPRTVKAPEALEIGLASRVVPDGELAEVVRDLTHRLAHGPTVAYGAIRRSVNHSAGVDFHEALAFESSMMTLTGGTSDHREAVQAFLAKERPRYEGR